MANNSLLESIRAQLQDPNTQNLLAQIAQLQSITGAGPLMGFGGGGQGTTPQGGGIFGPPQQGAPQRDFQGFYQEPVERPGQAPSTPNYGPQGTIFLGGSPFKPDFGPARLQNSLVFARDLLNSSSQFAESDMGRALADKLKNLFGGK